MPTRYLVPSGLPTGPCPHVSAPGYLGASYLPEPASLTSSERNWSTSVYCLYTEANLR